MSLSYSWKCMAFSGSSTCGRFCALGTTHSSTPKRWQQAWPTKTSAIGVQLASVASENLVRIPSTASSAMTVFAATSIACSQRHVRRSRILAMPSIFARRRLSDQRLASQTYSVGGESRPTSAHILRHSGEWAVPLPRSESSSSAVPIA